MLLAGKASLLLQKLVNMVIAMPELCECLQEYAALGPMQRRHLTLQHINDGLQLLQQHQQPGRAGSDTAVYSPAVA